MTNCEVRQVVNGRISDFAGLGNCTNQALVLTANPQTSEIGRPTGVAVDSSGNVYIAVCNDYRGLVLGASKATFSRCDGRDDQHDCHDNARSPLCSADGNSGNGAAWDVRVEGGNVYFSDVVNDVVDEATTSGTGLTSVAGSCFYDNPGGPNGTTTGSYSGDHGPATSANLNDPTGLYVDGSGNIFIADSDNRSRPGGVGRNHHHDRAAPTGFVKPFGVVEDSSGTVYVADFSGQCIKAVSGATITTLAGTCGTAGDNVTPGGIAVSNVLFGSNSPDGGGPSNLTFTPGGDLFVNDYGDNQVDQIVPAASVTPAGADDDDDNHHHDPAGSATSPPQPARATGWWLRTAASSTTGATSFYGSTGSIHLNKPVVGMAAAPGGAGYWLVASDGGIFNYGERPVLRLHAAASALNKPIVGMAATPDGKGYWLVASDGGIFNYGDAPFYGSTGATHLNKPIVGMAATPDGKGYWLVASDGGIFNYGDASFYGSTGSVHLNKPIVGMAGYARVATATGWWPRTAGSSTTATPSSTGRAAPSTSTSPSWPWGRPPTAGATGWRPPTAAYSTTATPPSRARRAGHRSTSPSWGCPQRRQRPEHRPALRRSGLRRSGTPRSGSPGHVWGRRSAIAASTAASDPADPAPARPGRRPHPDDLGLDDVIHRAGILHRWPTV